MVNEAVPLKGQWTGPKYFILNRKEGSTHIVFGVTLCSPGLAPDAVYLPDEVYLIAGKAFEVITEEFCSDKHLDVAVRELRDQHSVFKNAPIMQSLGLSEAAAVTATSIARGEGREYQL